MIPEQLASESDALLEKILNDAYSNFEEGNLRHAFIYRHARHILHLSKDVFELETRRAAYASGIIVRAMLEGLFNLVAAVKQPQFAAEKVVWEIEDEIMRIRKWLGTDSENLESAKQLEEFGASLRKQFPIPSRMNWKTVECANAAELGQQYRSEYFVLSKRSHAMTSVMIGTEKQFGRGYVLQTAIYILISAAGHLVQVLPTATPQKHVDSAAELVSRLTNAITQGAFEELGGD